MWQNAWLHNVWMISGMQEEAIIEFDNWLLMYREVKFLAFYCVRSAEITIHWVDAICHYPTMYYIIVDRSGFTVIFLISRTLNWLEHVNCWYIMICIFYILYNKARILYAVWMMMGTIPGLCSCCWRECLCVYACVYACHRLFVCISCVSGSKLFCGLSEYVLFRSAVHFRVVTFR